MSNVVFIDKSIGDIDVFERAKIGLEFLVENYRRHKFTPYEKLLLVQHYKERMISEGDQQVSSRDYTS